MKLKGPAASSWKLMAGPDSNANDAGVERPAQHEELPTPEDLISDTIETLHNAKGTDVALLRILADKIVTLKPAATALQDAVIAIEALAAKRAEGSDNDKPDHD